MKRSVDRILTTHTGSLIRPQKLLEFVKARTAGQTIDQSAYEATLKDSVRDVVARQVEAGVDIPNDGEFGKSTSWSLYVLKRLSGFELREVKGANPFARGADRLRFADFYAELEGRGCRVRRTDHVQRPLRVAARHRQPQGRGESRRCR
jgi:5-methyltetrahydropteroyltriglutamate--homocysteine methyltransferase